MSISLAEALSYLNTFREFIIDRDMPAAIKGNAIYLAALGLCTYTEILGGLYSGDLSKMQKQHYTSFIKHFFHPDYMIVDQDLTNDRLNGLYGAVRSGLVHEYFIKKISKVELESPLPIKCGIT
jgi:hypothetical protein